MPNKEKPDPRPSISTLEVLLRLAARVPAKSVSAAAAEEGYSQKGFDGQIKTFWELYGVDFLAEDAESNNWVLSTEGRQFVEYAEAVLACHRPLRSWPPTHEIVIGATPRTAVAYLPTFIAAFVESLAAEGQPCPQITIREGDTLELFLRRLQRGQTDFGLRGIPVDAAGTPKSSPCAGIEFFPVSEIYKPFAVSRKGSAEPEPKPVTMAELFRNSRVGVVSINVEDVVARLRKDEPKFMLPRSGLVVCDSHMALMALVEKGICAGLVFLPPKFTLKKPLVQREVTDLGWASQSFVFLSERTVRAPSTAMPDSKSWKREHFLARLKAVFQDAEVQRRALKPAYRDVPYM